VLALIESRNPERRAEAIGRGADEIEAYLRAGLGEQYWETLLRYRKLAVRHGLASPEPVPRFVETLLDLASRGLRQRRQGAEVFLAPVYAHLDGQSGPASHARTLFEEGGIAALMEEVSLTRDD
jgi:hypothetical protein